jgi:hypothetical protein
VRSKGRLSGRPFCLCSFYILVGHHDRVVTWENSGCLGGEGVGATVGVAIGFLAGAVVGVLLPAHHTIDSVNSH